MDDDDDEEEEEDEKDEGKDEDASPAAEAEAEAEADSDGDGDPVASSVAWLEAARSAACSAWACAVYCRRCASVPSVQACAWPSHACAAATSASCCAAADDADTGPVEPPAALAGLLVLAVRREKKVPTEPVRRRLMLGCVPLFERCPHDSESRTRA